MKAIGRLIALVLVVGVFVLMLTSLPWWWGEAIHGKRLLAHMTASGAVVVGLPLFAVFVFARGPQRGAAWTWIAVTLGTATIASMFVCMLPLLGTASQRTAIGLHGWLGWFFAATLLVGFALRVRAAR